MNNIPCSTEVTNICLNTVKKKIKNNKERRLFDLDPSKLYDLKKKKYYLISLREIRFYKLNFHRREIFRLTHCLL